MSDLLTYLRRLNSKERFFFIGHVLGKEGFPISRAFRSRLEETVAISIPPQVFSAMDYHLDWLYASMCVAAPNSGSGPFSNREQMIMAQQEDIDYLIAFEARGSHHIILIEAKAKSGWVNSQLLSKVMRLSTIFGPDGQRWNSIEPHFLLMSPNVPSKVDVSRWPGWMRDRKHPYHLRLPVPDDLLKVARCTRDGRQSENGSYWKVVAR